jgi:hypothetical protein
MVSTKRGSGESTFLKERNEPLDLIENNILVIFYTNARHLQVLLLFEVRSKFQH